MTEREKQLIEAYIPSPRDKTLDFDEYYIEDKNGRIVKGWLSEIGATNGHTVYRLRNNKGIIYGYYSDEQGYARMCHLYDNKEDCKKSTHYLYDNWEQLRDLQND